MATSGFFQAPCVFYSFTCNSGARVTNIVVGHMCSPNLFDLLVLLTVVTVNDVDRVSLGWNAHVLWWTLKHCNWSTLMFRDINCFHGLFGWCRGQSCQFEGKLHLGEVTVLNTFGKVGRYTASNFWWLLGKECGDLESQLESHQWGAFYISFTKLNFFVQISKLPISTIWIRCAIFTLLYAV